MTIEEAEKEILSLRTALAKAERRLAWQELDADSCVLLPLQQKRAEDAESKLSAFTKPVGEKKVEEALAAVDDLSDGSKHDWRKFAHRLARALRQARAALVVSEGFLREEKAQNEKALSRLADAEKVVDDYRRLVDVVGEVDVEIMREVLSAYDATKKTHKGEIK